jgi:hypothetical protein
MISEMLCAIEGHMVKVMTSEMLSYQMRKLFYNFSVLAAMQYALELFHISDQ